ncbi:MAG TPA: bifunctional (p)ppGpp synthetase/guanosine-3',5'-bis(diphosphate) 3'-pyrophosphohydrolase [Anaerolineales bacterium]|nr:bifunctional (p)ppGpp synthetase/guanosine-3',5'-bis(diphosphate) 3'-pyrophosphohydrolase [Anaerolineales bacterium]
MDLLPDDYTPADREVVMRAYETADRAHKGQKRASGEPYVNHCLAVAAILTEYRVPAEVIAAGLLHDTVEDTDLTLDDLRKEFGDEVARLVDGVTKLTTLPRVSRGDQHAEEDLEENGSKKKSRTRKRADPDAEDEERSRSRKYDMASETLRKTFLAMGDDVRVVLIKLADRLHNMRTLGILPEAKRRTIARQTMDIFAPLANRLGIWQIKWELEDLGFRYTEPDRYKEIAELLADRRVNRETQLKKIENKLKEVLDEASIEAVIISRPKHIYSIYKKMTRKEVPFDMVHDVRGVRILVPDINSCYAALGVIHTRWRPIPYEFDDYIAAPKENFYQSLHTAVIWEDGKTLEVQIRTPEMDQQAEYGIAAHWRYKEGSRRDEEFERRIVWLRQLMEWRQDVEDAVEFVDGMKTDVFGDRVYVFTPKGDIIDLPSESTPIDFAFHVHTEVGYRCRGAKVNGKLVSLDHQLETGDIVEILTAKHGGPSRDWLNPNLGLVKSQRARSKIRRWFKRQAREQNLVQGKNIFDRELRRLGLSDVDLSSLAKSFEFKTVDDFYVAIGCGDLQVGRTVNHLILEEDGKKGDAIPITRPSVPPRGADRDSIRVLGLKGLLTTFGRCCNPAPGDDIIGYITRGRGATIHRRDCPNVLRVTDRERLVRVSWGEPKTTFPVPIRIKAYDRDGLMRDISTVISDENINMGQINVDVNKNQAVFNILLEVDDISQLSRVLTRLENLPNVMEAQRIRPG